MSPSSTDHAKLKRRRLARVGTAEGYLALLLVVLGFVAPAVIPPPPEPYDLPIGISLWAVTWLFSLSGFRHGYGYGRIAAGLSLSLLSLHAITAVLLGLFGSHIARSP